MDKSPQPLELAENCDNEETFENVTKNDQDTMSNNYSQRNYAFSQAGTLRRHLKTHRGERPNKCDQCNYTCSQAGNLKTHLKTHSGTKSSKCNQCNYRVSQKKWCIAISNSRVVLDDQRLIISNDT